MLELRRGEAAGRRSEREKQENRRVQESPLGYMLWQPYSNLCLSGLLHGQKCLPAA